LNICIEEKEEKKRKIAAVEHQVPRTPINASRIEKEKQQKLE